jgi:CBS-domain-containing membrane protein
VDPLSSAIDGVIRAGRRLGARGLISAAEGNLSVRLDAGPREVAEVTSKYNLLAVPVVDQHNRIQGIVTVDDVMERVMPARIGARRRRIF